MINMNANDVWKLFEKTGKLEYYIMYRKMREGKIDTLGDKES